MSFPKTTFLGRVRDSTRHLTVVFLPQVFVPVLPLTHKVKPIEDTNHEPIHTVLTLFIKSADEPLLLYRRLGDALEVFLAHPGGPFWAHRDAGAWSLPKGLVDDGEQPLAAACREFEEEKGIRPTGPFLALGRVRQKAGKRIHAWAWEGDADPAHVTSNLMRTEWPRGSGLAVCARPGTHGRGERQPIGTGPRTAKKPALWAVRSSALFGAVLGSRRVHAHWSPLFPDARVADPLDFLSAILR
jgi:predicted NUDIX family NTP pyrophosphohydrolase